MHMILDATDNDWLAINDYAQRIRNFPLSLVFPITGAIL
jgi:hypothetical protein